MTLKWIRDLRLQNQQISISPIQTPEELVSHMLAMQAQVYPMAKWAIGLRVRSCADQQVEDAFNDGKILRTHVLRPTWHFVSPTDMRWLLKLTGPRVLAFNKTYYGRHELDQKLFTKCNNVLVKSLRGGKQFTRTFLQEELKKAKIKVAGIRLAFVMMQAELEGIICSGKKEGKQFTYALLEERVPPLKEIGRDESLFLIAHKYFTSRGPATINDFGWWSGLSIKECREGIELCKNKLNKETQNGKEFFFFPNEIIKSSVADRTFIMPDYDEYGIAYKDRSAILGEKVSDKSHASLGYPHVLVIDGVIAGTWKISKGKKNATLLQTKIPARLQKIHKSAISLAAKRFTEFTHLTS